MSCSILFFGIKSTELFFFTGVQIYSVSENIHFLSTKSNIKISPLKSGNPLISQGISGRYLFCRPLMACPTGFEPATSRVGVLRAIQLCHGQILACRFIISQFILKVKNNFMILKILKSTLYDELKDPYAN